MSKTKRINLSQLNAGTLTNGFIVCGIESPEWWTKWTFHLHFHHVIFIISLQHCYKNKHHRERQRVNKRNPASWLALVLAPQWLKRLLYGQSQYCTPMALPVRWHEPAGSFCCQSNTELSVHMALTDSVVSSSLRVSMHTHTHTPLPLQALFTPFTKYTRAHFASHLPTFTQTHLSHTCIDCEVSCRHDAKCATLPITQWFLHLPP